MSDVKMNLTQTQYGFVINLLQTIPRAFALVDDEDLEDSLPALDVEVPAPSTDGHADSAETVDLMPELSSVARAADGHIIQLQSSLELTFTVGTIYLEVFDAKAWSKETLKDASLARFSLNSTGLKYKMLSNGSMEAELVVRSFTVHDTRTTIQTKFREIIPATSHSGHQFMANYTQSGGSDKSSVANITVDSPKVIFSLDPLFALLDFTMSAFPSTPNPTPTLEVEDGEPDTPLPSDSAATFAFRVNIVSPTVIMLDDPTKADTEAVVLSINQVQMSQQGTLALTATTIGMFLCKVSPHLPGSSSGRF